MEDLWWVKRGGVPLKKDKNLSIKTIKNHYRMTRVLRWYEWDEYNPHNNFHDWVPIRCPFHDDEHMSASLNASQDKFRCHACDIGGDVVDLVKEVEGFKTITETLKWIVENVK
jgi:hypothetical protein